MPREHSLTKMTMIRDLKARPKDAATGGGMALLAHRLGRFFYLSVASVNFGIGCSNSMIALVKDIATVNLQW